MIWHITFLTSMFDTKRKCVKENVRNGFKLLEEVNLDYCFLKIYLMIIIAMPIIILCLERKMSFPKFRK